MAAPVLSVNASRTSGTAPLAVFFDATGTTDADTTTPFHDLLHSANFGDFMAGNWTYGANTDASKNLHIGGPLAAHVYETAGSYTVTWSVTDGINIVSTTISITVTAADTTYSGTNTICVSTTGNFSGAPAGCLTVQDSDFDNPGGTTLATYLNAGKRVLYCGGETFIASSPTVYTGSGPAQVGSYGSGRAKLQWTGAPSSSGFLRYGGTCNDLRITDLEIDGQGVTTQSAISFQNTAWTNALLLNNYIHDIGLGLGPDWSASGGSGFFMFWNRLENPAVTNATDAVLVSQGSVVAIMGNNINNNGEWQQGIRINHMTKFVVNHNTVAGVISPKSSIDFRSSDTIMTQYGIASDNLVLQGASLFGINPSSANTNMGIFDMIFERNYVLGIATGNANTAIGINAERITIRNNLIDATSVDMATGIALRGTNSGGSLPSKDVKVYNNTIYSAKASGSLTGVSVDTDVSTGNVIKNTIVYTSIITGTVISDAGGKATAATNTGDLGSVTTSPAFDNVANAPVGFRIGTGSYAATGGTAIFPPSNCDFYNGDDSTANEHIGAMISRARVQCRGVSGR